ncbi:hypothetical protein OV203_02515 [Nannocystis sp. ILAH1]|uniref:hypothetical protein n=1 Tax=Nannocystis sp. ILAH1 TaxID=2996789 RepID=UPI00226E36DD|nr:hypothetical protein [Nannocystis sp. ILAH1]MCY0985985.1 hypothetical protein [Nannocystis sp. ILAH1]
MTGVDTGRRGRPKKSKQEQLEEADPALAALAAEVRAADAVVLECVRAHQREPTQGKTIDLLNAQFRVASLRAHLARTVGDGNAAKHETDLAIRLAKARDDAVGRLWGDELDRLHEMVTRAGHVQMAINAELEAELGEE